MTNYEVMQMALEALEGGLWDYKDEHERCNEVITALREALAQPQGESVSLPCCGYTNPEAIKWNQFNGVVQCHNCGQVYNITPPSVEAAIEATKEKAAKVCDKYAAGGAGSEWDMGYLTAAQSCAAAIRGMK